jgi:hypothetical protein
VESKIFIYVASANVSRAMAYFRRLIACISLRRLEFSPMVVHVGFMMNIVEMRQAILLEILFSLISYHFRVLRTYLRTGTVTVGQFGVVHQATDTHSTPVTKKSVCKLVSVVHLFPHIVFLLNTA